MEGFKSLELSSPNLVIEDSSDFSLEFSKPIVLLENFIFNENSFLFESSVKSDILFFDETNINSFISKAQFEISDNLVIKPFIQEVEIVSRFSLPTQNIDTRLKAKLEHPDFKSINVLEGLIEIEKEKLFFTGNISEIYPLFKAKASVDVKRLRLSRWFSFSRNLSPTLSNLLDNLSATGDLFFEGNKIFSNNLNAKLGIYDFEGVAKYTFAKNHLLDLNFSTDEINLDTIFPEPLGNAEKKLEYKNIHLDTEIKNLPSSSENTEGKSTLTYRVGIKANKIKYYKFEGEGVQSAIYPSKDMVKIDLDVNDMNSGKLFASAFLASSSINIVADASKISSKEILEPFLAKPIIEGKFDAKINFAGKGNNLYQAFTKMTGNANVKMENGFFRQEKGTHSFNLLNIDAKINGNEIVKENKADTKFRNFTGNALINLQTSSYSALVEMPNFDAIFDRTTVELQKISDNKTVASINMIKPYALNYKTLGELSFDYPLENISYNNIDADGDNFSFFGDVKVESFKNTKISGEIDLIHRKFIDFLYENKLLETNLKDKFAYSYLNLKVPFEYENSKFTSKNLKGSLDDTNFTAELSHDFSKKNVSHLFINIDKINIDRYTTTQEGRKKNTPPFASQKEIPLAFLQKIKVRGNIYADELWFLKNPFLRANIPFSLNGGTIKINSTASFPSSGSMALDMQGKIYSGYMLFDTKWKAQEIDLQALSKARGDNLIIAGKGFTEGSVSNVISIYSDIVNTLDGYAILRAQQGYFVDAEKKAEKDSFYPLPSLIDKSKSKTYFSTFSLSSTIREGIITSSDITMNGDLNFQGNAKIDLPNWKLDLKGNVNYADIASIPIDINGSLSEPDLEVRILKAFTTALQSIGSGVLNIITAPLKLLPTN